MVKVNLGNVEDAGRKSVSNKHFHELYFKTIRQRLSFELDFH